jgi:hypothetical protein
MAQRMVQVVAAHHHSDTRTRVVNSGYVERGLLGNIQAAHWLVQQQQAHPENYPPDGSEE